MAMKKTAKKAAKKKPPFQFGKRQNKAEGGITFGQGFLGTKPVDERDKSALSEKKKK